MSFITVAVTTYNRWELCLKALESVCGQEGVDVEVVLVDDCSAAPMPDQVQDFVQANGVVFIRHDTNKGLAAARNTAIAAASGKYFFWHWKPLGERRQTRQGKPLEGIWNTERNQPLSTGRKR